MVVDWVGVNGVAEAFVVADGDSTAASLSNPRRRSNVGKSDAPPPNDSAIESPVTGRCAGGSASIGSDPPCAFSSADRACPAWKHRVILARRRPLAAVPMAPAQPVFPSALA